MSTYRLTPRAHWLIRRAVDAGIIGSMALFTWLFFVTMLAWWA